MPRVTNTLFQLWSDREKQEGRRITLREVAEKTGLSVDTLRNLRENETSRFDESVLVALCGYFEIPPGPIPFLIYTPDAPPKS